MENMLSVDCRNLLMDEYYTDYFKERQMMGEVYSTFAKKATGQSKFLYTYGLLKEHKKLPDKCNVAKNSKSNKCARKVRAQGNKWFASKDYVRSLCAYNISLMAAVVDSADFTLALANRSAALYYLEEYDACINDIRYALANRYPSELAYKLYEREGNCHRKLGNIARAKDKFQECLAHLAQTQLSRDKKKTIKTQLKMFLSEPITEQRNNHDDKKLPITLLGGPNKSIPALSKLVKIKYSESMGRCLYVTDDIQPGDVLAIEKPYAGILRSESLMHNCRYCFKRCLTGVPCTICTSVMYCDNSCRQKSFESGHKYECKLFITLIEWPGIDHMEYLSLYIFLKTVTNLGLEKYVTLVESLKIDTTDPMTRGFNNFGKFMSDQFCSTYSLEGNEARRTVSDLFIRHCYASVMVSCLKLSGLEIPDHLLGVVGESLVHIICVVASNAHAITQPPTHKSWTLLGMKEFMPVASVLLPTLSLLNHNCDPNVVRHNYSGTVVLRAIQPISKNSQLFDNYGKVYATHTKDVRQQMLKNQYCFQCSCQSCIENWSTYDVLYDTQSYLKKPVVNYPLLKKIDKSILINRSNQLTIIIAEMKEDKTDGLEHLQFLYSFLTLLYNTVKKPWYEYCDCQETIKQVLYITADKFVIEHN